MDKNFVFVVDPDRLRTSKDIACDDMGSWRLNNGKYHSPFCITSKGNVIFAPKQVHSKYKLIQSYVFLQQSSPDLLKTICTIQGIHIPITHISHVYYSRIGPGSHVVIAFELIDMKSAVKAV